MLVRILLTNYGILPYTVTRPQANSALDVGDHVGGWGERTALAQDQRLITANGLEYRFINGTKPDHNRVTSFEIACLRTGAEFIIPRGAPCRDPAKGRKLKRQPVVEGIIGHTAQWRDKVRVLYLSRQRIPFRSNIDALCEPSVSVADGVRIGKLGVHQPQRIQGAG